MHLSAEAWRLRQAARTTIAAGDYGRSLELAVQARQTQSTPAGEALCKLSEWAGG